MSVHNCERHPSADCSRDETQTHDAWNQLFDLLARDVAKRLKADAEQVKLAAAPAASNSKTETGGS